MDENEAKLLFSLIVIFTSPIWVRLFFYMLGFINDKVEAIERKLTRKKDEI